MAPYIVNLKPKAKVKTKVKPKVKTWPRLHIPAPLCLRQQREDCRGPGLFRLRSESGDRMGADCPANCTAQHFPQHPKCWSPQRHTGTRGTIVRPKRLTARTGTLQTPSYQCAITTRSLVFRVQAPGSPNSPAFLPRVGNLSRLSTRKKTRVPTRADD